MEKYELLLKTMINKYIDLQQNEFAPSNDSDIIDDLLDVFSQEELINLGFGEFIKDYFED